MASLAKLYGIKVVRLPQGMNTFDEPILYIPYETKLPIPRFNE